MALYDAATPPTNPISKRERYEKLLAAYWTERQGGGFDSHWRELGDFLLPRRTRFWSGDRNRGDKRNQNIIDSSGRFAARTLASGLHAGLTSPARPWMRLTTPEPELAENPAVKEWLHVVTQRMLTLFLQSNLYNALPIVYGDMGVFGTAAMSIMEDTRDLFRAYPYPIGSYAIGLDSRGVVTTFIREYDLTVRTVVQTFGGPGGQPLERGQPIQWQNISATVKDLWNRGDYETAVNLCWIVLPNEDADATKLGAKFFPWSSCHFERDAQSSGASAVLGFLRESGYRTFPVLCPRWDVNSPEDSYGTDCPGMTALGDIKQLQIMQRRKGQAIAKQVDPPLVGPSSLRTQKTSLLAGDITYVDVREGQQGLKSIHDVNLNLADMTADIRETQYRIQRAFYEDLFLMLAQQDVSRGSTQPMTAREVDERHEEKLLALGPVLERTNDELLDPLIDRVYGMMERADLLPPAPEELSGVNLKVEYISILAASQKLVGVVGQDRFLQSALGLIEAFPEVRHKVRIFQAIDNYGEMLGVDPRVVVPTEEAEAAAAEQAKAQQSAQDAENAKTLGQGLAAAGAKPIAPDSALDRMVQGATPS
jgi:hypothetical protein